MLFNLENSIIQHTINSVELKPSKRPASSKEAGHQMANNSFLETVERLLRATT